MGMVRAIGVQRYRLVLMYLFEGSVYDVFASLIGLLFGLGISVFLVKFLEPILARFNFPLKFTLQPHSLIIAYCLGVIFTFCSVALSCWLVSRMTVVEAMRDLPEPNRSMLSFGELSRKLASVGQQLASCLDSGSRLSWLDRMLRHLLAHMPSILIGIVGKLTVVGLIPLLVGALLMRFGLTKAEIIPFSLGLSLLILGGGLLVKTAITQIILLMIRFRSKEQSHKKQDWHKVANSVFAALAGSALVAYWALPFDVLERL